MAILTALNGNRKSISTQMGINKFVRRDYKYISKSAYSLGRTFVSEIIILANCMRKRTMNAIC